MRTTLIGFTLLVLNVLILRATNFEVRYLLCALLLAPMAIFMWLDARGAEHRVRSPGLLPALIFLSGIGGFAALAERAEFYHKDCRSCYEEMPVEALVSALRANGFETGTMITSNYYVGGNLRLAFPHARVIATNYPVRHPLLQRDGPCLLVWNARLDGEALPTAIRQWVAANGIQLPAMVRPT